MGIKINSMKPQSIYSIEYLEEADGTWKKLHGFLCMRKSYAEGAWDMLCAHYNQKRKHRLVRDGEVIASCDKQTLTVN